MFRRVLQLSFLAAIVAAIWIGKPYFDQWQADRARIAEEQLHKISEERRQASLRYAFRAISLLGGKANA